MPWACRRVPMVNRSSRLVVVGVVWGLRLTAIRFSLPCRDAFPLCISPTPPSILFLPHVSPICPSIHQPVHLPTHHTRTRCEQLAARHALLASLSRNELSPIEFWISPNQDLIFWIQSRPYSLQKRRNAKNVFQSGMCKVHTYKVVRLSSWYQCP